MVNIQTDPADDDDDKEAPSCSCCCLCCCQICCWCVSGMVGLGIWMCWNTFSENLVRYNDQRPAMCIDAPQDAKLLTINRKLAEIKLELSREPDEHCGPVPLKCVVPTAVYLCKDVNDTIEDWNGVCRELETDPWKWRGGSQLPFREIDNVGTCTFPECKYNCKDSEWDKAETDCISKLANAVFPCLLVQSEGKVHLETSGYPYAALFGGIVCSMSVIVLCCLIGLPKPFAHDTNEKICCSSVGFLSLITISALGCILASSVKGCNEDAPERVIRTGNHGDLNASNDLTRLISIDAWRNSTNLDNQVGKAGVLNGVSFIVLICAVGISVPGLVIVIIALLAILIRSVGKDARAKAVVAADVTDPSRLDALIRQIQVHEDLQRQGSEMSRKDLNNLARVRSGEIQTDRSRKEVDELVRQTSGLSQSERAAHRILSVAEDTISLTSRVNSRVMKNLALGSPKVDQSRKGKSILASRVDEEPAAQNIGAGDAHETLEREENGSAEVKLNDIDVAAGILYRGRSNPEDLQIEAQEPFSRQDLRRSPSLRDVIVGAFCGSSSAVRMSTNPAPTRS